MINSLFQIQPLLGYSQTRQEEAGQTYLFRSVRKRLAIFAKLCIIEIERGAASERFPPCADRLLHQAVVGLDGVIFFI